MIENAPSREEWVRLFELAAQVKALSPWDWMYESDLFGVRDPESGETGFVSIMGTLGEHFAVAVYLGSEGFHGFWDIQVADLKADPGHVLRVPQLQLSFEDRGELTPEERRTIKELGLKFRGRNAWPMFRSYRPGFVPWDIESGEARFLETVLGQLLEVAPRLRERPAAFPAAGREGCVVRIPQRESGRVVWEDSFVAVPLPEVPDLSLEISAARLEEIRELPRSLQDLELDLFMTLLTTEDERDARAYYPFVLLMVDGRSAMIVGCDLLPPVPSIDAVWEKAARKVLDQFEIAGRVPRAVDVRDRRLFDLLRPVSEQLHFELCHTPVLPTLDEAKAGFLQHFMGFGSA